MSTSTATIARPSARMIAAAAALGLAAAAAAPAMSEATAHAEAPSISVQHEGEQTTISTADVTEAGVWGYDQRSFGCWLFPALC